ncbi:hypothetical protein B0H13DRAFT_362956 [Mycena leptocephala]|nr:hypothetical protein B0H13DRAFT_362956 [Mycena leptocephala]
MSASASELFYVQELCDRIVSHVKLDESSQDDLKSLALVSQTLCSSAQAQIFRHVSLDPWDSEMGKLSTNPGVPRIPISARRLSVILAASPHLLPHIRSLRVLAQIEILELVLKMQLPLVKKIAFNFQVTRGWGSDDRLPRLTGDLIGLPSIREVEICQLSTSFSFLSLKLLPSLFQRCSQDIHTLAFISFSATFAFPTTSAPCPPERRAKIKRLELCQAAHLPAWLISPSSPFDFTHLVELDTDGHNTDSDLLRILSSARLSIRQLRMTETLALLANLSDFPALTHLEIQGSYYETVGTLKPDNCVETLIFHFRADSFLINRHSGLYASVDAFVSSLRQVEVQMRGSFHGPRRAMKGRLRCLPECFPHLAGRGLLIVTDYSLCIPNMSPPADHLI